MTEYNECKRRKWQVWRHSPQAQLRQLPIVGVATVRCCQHAPLQSPFIRLLWHVLKHGNTALVRNHAFIHTHRFANLVSDLPCSDEWSYHRSDLEWSIMARLTSRYCSRIIGNVEETKNGKKPIPRHNRTETWHAQHPVSRPVRTIGVSTFKPHDNERAMKTLISAVLALAFHHWCVTPTPPEVHESTWNRILPTTVNHLWRCCFIRDDINSRIHLVNYKPRKVSYNFLI